MGLDMYLTGEKYIPSDFEHPERDATEDGFRLKSRRLELGYWRKHPNLHGFIVQTFADGNDECQPIELSAEDLRTILEASRNKQLPETRGFFFGTSTPERDEETERVLLAAIKWLETDEPDVWKSVVYQASW